MTEDCYQDDNFHLLALDIAHFGSYQNENIFDTQYIPSLEEYDPNITKQMWINILKDNEITNEKVMPMLRFMLNNNGESTCSSLAKVLGGSATNYISIGTNFGKNIHDKHKIKLFDNHGNYYAIPFIGKYVKEDGKERFSWTLRSELKEALENMETLNTTKALEEIIASLKDLGGQASLNDIYNRIEYRGKLPALQNAIDYKASVRSEIYKHSSDCDAYVDGNEDIFISVGGKRSGIWGLRDIPKNQNTQKLFASNIILYGPPGTGKTYNTVNYAVAIIENKTLDIIKSESYNDVFERYNEYKKQGLIEFTTFHQSYGYEEFIEGIKPEFENEELKYTVESGIFKKFCDKIYSSQIDDFGINGSPKIWKVSLEGANDNPTRAECLKNNHIRVGYDEYGENISNISDYYIGGKSVLDAFYNKMRIGDIIMSCYNSTTIDAIGIITGNCEWNNNYDYYRRLRNVKWILKDIREDIFQINNEKNLVQSTVYQLNMSLNDIINIIKKYEPYGNSAKYKKQNHVFIIDEINRGNISKIFGELITLIEESKRKGASEETSAKLPYSGKTFSVPDNVYILGTMNTADRSIAAIDTALRRRFSFEEMLPDSSLLENVEVESLNIAKMLDVMNRKITALYDREHTIGHAYLLPLKTDNTIKNLANIFENKIIPLLQEYFFEDYEKIQLVLGDNFKDKNDNKHKFIIDNTETFKDLFGTEDSDNYPDDFVTYKINKDALNDIESYKFICKTGEQDEKTLSNN